jgi:hypothetical protein
MSPVSRDEFMRERGRRREAVAVGGFTPPPPQTAGPGLPDRVYRNIIEREATEIVFPGGRLHRQGGTFRIDVLILRAGVGLNQDYFTPCVVAPGTDNLRFVVDFDPPVWDCVSKGSCLSAGRPLSQAWFVDSLWDKDGIWGDVGDNSTHIIQMPFFHGKFGLNSFSKEEPLVEQVQFWIQPRDDGTDFNDGVFEFPEIGYPIGGP